MKRPEEMTDAELDASLAALQSNGQPTQTGINYSAMGSPAQLKTQQPQVNLTAQTKLPEQMTEAELDAEIARLSGGQKQPESIEVEDVAADIPWQDRLAVKNLGGSIEDQVDYLKRKNPQLDVRAYNGEIVAKTPGDKAFKKLDPTWSLSPAEAIQDITDIGYDVASGALTGAAGAAGAVPGALGGFGVGGLGTAMAASGAASAGLEGLRQALGVAGGVRKDISGGEIATSGLLGGLTTGIFGGGATKGLIEKSVENPSIVAKQLKKVMDVVPEGMQQDAKKAFASKIIEDSQKGLISRKLGSKALSLVSGVDEQAIKRANDYASPELVAKFQDILDPAKKYTMMELNDLVEKEGAGEIGSAAIETFVTAANDYKNTLQGKIGTIIEQIDAPVDANRFRKPLEDYIDSLVNQMKTEPGGGLKSTKELLDEARKAADLFGVVETPQEGIMAGAEELRRGLRSGEPLNISAKSFYDLKNSISDRLDFQASQVALDGKPIKSKRVKEILSTINKDMGTELDDLMKPLSKNENIRQEYAKLKNFQRVLAPKFKNEETALKALSNSKTIANKVFRQNVEEFSNQVVGSPVLLDLADLANVNKVFGQPSLEAVSSGGATSTGKFLRGGTIGAGVGYLGGLATGVPGAANTGAIIGGTIGSLATSPASIKQVLKAQSAVKSLVKNKGTDQIKNVIQKLNDQYANESLKSAQEYLTPQAVPQSVWQIMKGNR